jgi:hypothetical protein
MSPTWGAEGVLEVYKRRESIRGEHDVAGTDASSFHRTIRAGLSINCAHAFTAAHQHQLV